MIVKQSKCKPRISVCMENIHGGHPSVGSYYSNLTQANGYIFLLIMNVGSFQIPRIVIEHPSETVNSNAMFLTNLDISYLGVLEQCCQNY